MSDDEQESEETPVYTIVSEQGLEYDSTETISDLVYQIHDLVHGPKRDLAMLRSLTEDLWSLAAVNDDLMMSDTIGDLDGLDELPVGWKSEAPDDDEGEE